MNTRSRVRLAILEDTAKGLMANPISPAQAVEHVFANMDDLAVKAAFADYESKNILTMSQNRHFVYMIYTTFSLISSIAFPVFFSKYMIKKHMPPRPPLVYDVDKIINFRFWGLWAGLFFSHRTPFVYFAMLTVMRVIDSLTASPMEFHRTQVFLQVSLSMLASYTAVNPLLPFARIQDHLLRGTRAAFEILNIPFLLLFIIQSAYWVSTDMRIVWHIAHAKITPDVAAGMWLIDWIPGLKDAKAFLIDKCVTIVSSLITCIGTYLYQRRQFERALKTNIELVTFRASLDRAVQGHPWLTRYFTFLRLVGNDIDMFAFSPIFFMDVIHGLMLTITIMFAITYLDLVRVFLEMPVSQFAFPTSFSAF